MAGYKCENFQSCDHYSKLNWVRCIYCQDSCRDLLAVMLSPSVMTIWNADTGTKVSRFTFTETIVSFVFNPFQSENLIREWKLLYISQLYQFFFPL